MAKSKYKGVLVIGDPHLEGRQPGFRKDDYPRVILEKLQWCLGYADQNQLLPVILGDFFDKPRDNPTWILCQLIEMLNTEVVGVYGNHDCADPELNEHDSLSLLIKAGCIQLVDHNCPWCGRINGRPVIVGGSSYRQFLPDAFNPSDEEEDGSALVIWLAHHDIGVPGYEEQGRVKPQEIPGVDVVINGHIHRKLDPFQIGRTLWLTPGNISRRTRSEATFEHVPSVLRINVRSKTWSHEHVEVPHRPFEEVFHEMVEVESVDTSESAFIAGLAELQARKTDSAAGLMQFLEKNLEQFEDEVAQEIMVLVREVTSDG
ncbi:MAG: metallophosphoesterase [Candidatus Bipolaricaulia bacterium]